MLNIQLLLTGNELMSGDITDTNSVYIAQELKSLGIEVERKVTVGDNIDLLVNEMDNLSKSADIIIVNGGLGPTVDDMTAQALAKLADVPLTLHPVALEQLKAWCINRGYYLTGPNMKQAILPANCSIISNPLGSAPGFSLRHNNCQIICTPGVPVELKAMMQQEIIPDIAKQLPNDLQTVTEKFTTFGIGESGLQKLINEQFPDWPAEIELGFRAIMPLLEVKLTSRSSTSSKLRNTWFAKMKQLLGQHIVSEQGESIASTVVNELSKQGKKITTAESCTGGMIASLLTNIPGSSQVFEAGFVTYSNRIKSKLVNVSEHTLTEHGAVSEAVVKEMAGGALEESGADFAIAISGIAGPDGGTEDKPVGTVWIAWGEKNNIRTQHLFFPAHRMYFQSFMASTGLDLIRRMLLNYNDEPRYVVERQRQLK